MKTASDVIAGKQSRNVVRKQNVEKSFEDELSVLRDSKSAKSACRFLSRLGELVLQRTEYTWNTRCKVRRVR
jgi:hypothetical protein